MTDDEKTRLLAERVILGWGPMEFHGDTLIDTLRRAKEAAR